jgi:hypothetical protein
VVDVRAVAAVCVLLTGCFYIDPILPRPSFHIDAPDTIYRGGLVTMTAKLDDTDGPEGSFDWEVYSCTGFGNGTPAGCDKTRFFPPPSDPMPDDSSSIVSFTVPPRTTSGDKTEAIKIRLITRNDRGALALSDGNTVFPVGNGPPVVELTTQSHSLAVGAPIEVIATFSDVDSPLDGVVLAWTATAPDSTQPLAFPEVAIAQDPADRGHRKAARLLTPTVQGMWNVQVTATDPEGGSTVQRVSPLTVVPDGPPCLRQWLPTVPPPGATLPISTPTVFQVPVVDDDLDPYPPISEAPELRFAWSVLRPGAPREVQTGATGNAIVLDPAAYTPGDVVELRVEIYDRQQTVLPCDDTAATCSIRSSDSCLQRQTWRIEVR